MSTEPLVSVLIPSYNRAHVIAQTIESVLAQSWPHLEIVVIDDGSKDDTAAAVAPYRDRITFIQQANQGLAETRNTAMRRSKGELIAWLDSDDLWNPEKLALQVAVLAERPEVAVVAGDFSAFDDDGFFEESHVRGYYSVIDKTPGGLDGIFPERMELGTRGLLHLPPGLPETVAVYCGDIFEKLIGGNCLHPPTVLFRRDAATRAGWLDKRFRKDSDYEYLLRLSRQGQVAFIDRPLMRYRYSPDQMSSDKYLADIVVSRVLVMESLASEDPKQLASEAFRRRLGYSHVAAAHALADEQRGPAVQHLVRSLRFGHADPQTARTIVKLLLPRWVVERYRKLRHPSG